MIPIFQELSKRIGKQKVIWRYDPIIFTKKYTPEYHLKAFEQIAKMDASIVVQTIVEKVLQGIAANIFKRRTVASTKFL